MVSELVSTSLLKNNTGQIPGLPKNPRLIKDDRYELLKKSIQDDPEMLELREVIAYDNNGELVVIMGNMRLKACLELEIKQIPCKVLPKETPVAKLAAYSIKDNVPFGETVWEDILADWSDFPIADWGLDVPDWANKAEAKEDDYEIPDEIQTDIVLGDLFEIGEHRLLCGDSTDSDAVGRVMNQHKADMVFTDPPYNINYGNIKHPKFKQREIENDNMSGVDFGDFCTGFISNIVLYNKGCVYMAGPPGPDGRIMFMAADKVLHCSTVIIWNKDQFTLGRGKYQNKYEPIWFGWVDNGISFFGDRKQTNVWDIPRPKRSEEHPTMKPVELVAKAVGHASRNDDIVLDLFLGSGTTMVAAHQLNRKCYGIEIDPKYCQVIIERMLKLDPALTITKNGLPYAQKK